MNCVGANTVSIVIFPLVSNLASVVCVPPTERLIPFPATRVADNANADAVANSVAAFDHVRFPLPSLLRNESAGWLPVIGKL